MTATTPSLPRLPQIDKSLLLKTEALVARAHGIEGLHGPAEAPAPASLAHAAATLSELTRAAMSVTSRLTAKDDVLASELSDIVLSSLQLNDDVHARLAHHRDAAQAGLRRELSELRRISDSAALIDRVCPAVVSACGFSRAMLCRVIDGEWLPWMAHFPHDPALERALVAWMNEQRFPIDALGRDLLELRPVVVHDATKGPRVFRPMIEFAQTLSFVAAPIAPAGRLVGILYADRYPSSAPLDEPARDLLWAFAEEFGRIFERADLLERMRTQKLHMAKAFAFAEGMTAAVASAEIEFALAPEARAPAGDAVEQPAGRDAIAELLTDREKDVLGMMVKGMSNAAIAQDLLIKEGTVKSHVKHILRKLDATNRTEAISRYIAGGSG